MMRRPFDHLSTLCRDELDGVSDVVRKRFDDVVQPNVPSMSDSTAKGFLCDVSPREQHE